MRKTILILAALAAVVCRAEPDDFATEAYAHFEATNEVEKAKAQIAASINTRCAQDRAYASSVASNALETAKSYADSLVVDLNADSIVSNAVETTILIVDGRGYLLPSATNGLAKASYVDAKVMEQIDLWKEELGTTNYAPKSWVLSLDYTTLGAVQSYLASMDYASKGHVSDNYVSKAQLNAADYASKTWVDSYLAEHMPDGGGLTPEDLYDELWYKRDMGDVDAPGWLLTGPDGKSEMLWYRVGGGESEVEAWYNSTLTKYMTHARIDPYMSIWMLSVDTFQVSADGTPATNATELAFTYSATNKWTATRIDSRLAFLKDFDAEIKKRSLGGIWDAGLEVWWTPVMTNGCLIYKATTNVNMNAEVTP